MNIGTCISKHITPQQLATMDWIFG